MIELSRYKWGEKTNHVCIACMDGWIICGIIKSDACGTIRLVDSAVVRSRSSIGYIEKYKDKQYIDEIGEIAIDKDKVLFAIPCEW